MASSYRSGLLAYPGKLKLKIYIQIGSIFKSSGLLAYPGKLKLIKVAIDPVDFILFRITCLSGEVET